MLTIPNPCTIQFASGKGIYVQNGGQILATSGNQINFTSQSGTWAGITFQYGGYGTLENCNFQNINQNTNTAILVDYSTGTGVPPANQIIDINGCTFNEYCNVEVNDNSVLPTYIENNTFTSGGIQINYSNAVQILNNTMSGSGAETSLSNSDVLFSNNTITNVENAVSLDNSTCTLNSNTLSGDYTVLNLSESSPILYNNNINVPGMTAIFNDYYSFPRMRPASSGDGTIIWDAGINNLTVSGSLSADINYSESSVDLAGGVNFINGGTDYLVGSVYPIPKGNYDATGNCWDHGVCDPNRFWLYGGPSITVSVDPCNCTPPLSSILKENDLNRENLPVYLAGGISNSNEDPLLDPPIQSIIINRGHGHFDTIKVTQGNINLPQNETVLSQATKQELLGNYSNALNTYESVVQNYHDSASAINVPTPDLHTVRKATILEKMG